RRIERVYVDGVFDLLHSGHFNALRQARLLGDRLIVGVNSDTATAAAKGVLPIYSEAERGEILRGCKWVDEVVVGTPYTVSLHLLQLLQCDFAAHGDDWVLGADGVDAYAEPRAASRMKIFKRTEGISSSTIIRRLLEATARLCKEGDMHFNRSCSPSSTSEKEEEEEQQQQQQGGGAPETSRSSRSSRSGSEDDSSAKKRKSRRRRRRSSRDSSR
ncbi:UNVERIFIED_CONTAM: hypothetical protein H355_002104, partial [Colinus virginianus]